MSLRVGGEVVTALKLKFGPRRVFGTLDIEGRGIKFDLEDGEAMQIMGDGR